MATSVEFEVRKDTIKEQLAKMILQAPKKIGAALYQEALIERKESMRRTPIQYGVLRASHEVTKPQSSGREIWVTIRVGGAAAPYAIHVHENVEAYHKEGQAKFLESTIRESAPYFVMRVAKRLNLDPNVSPESI